MNSLIILSFKEEIELIFRSLSLLGFECFKELVCGIKHDSLENRKGEAHSQSLCAKLCDQNTNRILWSIDRLFQQDSDTDRMLGFRTLKIIIYNYKIFFKSWLD